HGLDPVTADLAQLQAALREVTRVRRWLDGREVAFTNGLRALADVSPSVFPEAEVAEATGTSLHHGNQTAERAKTADSVPALADALADGKVSGEHLDAMTAGLRSLEPNERAALVAEGERLAGLAETMNPEQFRREIAKAARKIRSDGGMARLERQQRDVRMSAWVDPATGMVRINGRLDPITGAMLINRLDQQLDRLRHQPTPPMAPSDPLERTGFLRAHALLDLLGIPHPGTTADDGECDTKCAGCSCGGRVDLSIVLDATTWLFGEHPGTRFDCGIPGLDLPLDTVRRMAMFADITLAFIDEQGVVLKLGRTRRLANDDQRRALRIMYRHCAIPGCTVPVSRTEPHHTIEWDADHGPTDIENLVPICKHHHDLIHDNHWKLSLSPDRRLTVTYPDGTTMTTGPPSEQWT
ncbi:MAG: DUF222 domain-containing protein, partial [Ilumatobacteraceae bacterium]